MYCAVFVCIVLYRLRNSVFVSIVCVIRAFPTLVPVSGLASKSHPSLVRNLCELTRSHLVLEKNRWAFRIIGDDRRQIPGDGAALCRCALLGPPERDDPCSLASRTPAVKSIHHFLMRCTQVAQQYSDNLNIHTNFLCMRGHKILTVWLTSRPPTTLPDRKLTS